MKLEALAFHDLIRPDLVIHDLDFTSKEDALRTMATLLVERGHCRESFIEAILERERVHPSALPMAGPKIAIPHTDAEHVERSAILFARLQTPVEFRSMGDPEESLSVRLISMFALKEKRLIGNLLETLINVYQSRETLTALLEAPSAHTMYTILHEAVAEYGSR